ncbi:MAG TPA: hypothetical protein VMW16_00220 [Sedimentisphaerales bacterium]|nr:hypothetical protein [Sedimentisphaerales bacterium]
MREDKITNLLKKADQTAWPPKPPPANLAAVVRRHAHRRRTIRIAAPVAAAAVIVIAVGLWYRTADTAKRTQEQQRITSLEAQIKQLQARTDATLDLIREVLEYERKQRRLDQLQAELANIPDPLEESRREVDKAAFVLVYQADRMYKERNQKDSAVRTYNRVIELFPQTPSAETAKQRLLEIQKSVVNKNGSKI